MFNFTTTTVLNSNFESTNPDMPIWSIEGTEGDAKLHVKGINNFKSENVLKVYKAAYTEPENPEIKIDLSKIDDVEKGDTLRLHIYVRLTQADNCSYYANDTQFKGRPFTVEFPWLGEADKTVENLCKLIRKYGLLVFEKELIKASIAEDNAAAIVIKGTNEFQRFHTVSLSKFVDPDKPYKDEWVELDAEGLVEVVKEGVEGFGTYGWILRNIKLPTNAHTQAFSAKQDQMPIPGAHYNQYTIHYCTNRGPLGLNAVGHEVKSVTTSVFYVNTALLQDSEIATFAESSDAANFEAALRMLAGDKWEEVPERADEPDEPDTEEIITE